MDSRETIMNSNSSVLEKLKALSINSEVDEMRKVAKNAIFIAGRLALSGQITVFYAGPNTGKTLITLKLIAESIANCTVGEHVYHINLDDSFEGLITKADLGNRHGYKVLSPKTFTNPSNSFAGLVQALLDEGVANETVFILDTVKKFVDVMDKKACSAFMTACRRLTSAGGSIIALAHINKNKDDVSKGIPAGTSDILDDCDCAFVMDLVSEKKVPEGTEYFVDFQQKKSRGPVVEGATYSYVKFHDSDYTRMFNSVKLIDGNVADKQREERAREFELKKDAELINLISKFLEQSGQTITKNIIGYLLTESDISRRKATDCLNRWTGPTEKGGLWNIAKGHNNSSIYKLNSTLPP
jgi:hypothetical protein